MKGAKEYSTINVLEDEKQIVYVTTSWDLSIPDMVEHVMKIVRDRVSYALLNHTGDTELVLKMTVTPFNADTSSEGTDLER